MSPERIQLSRKKGWRLPENTEIVARPTPLGNPYKVYEHCKGDGGDWGVLDLGKLHTSIMHGWTRLGAQKFAVSCYRELLDEVYPPGGMARTILAMNLAGKNLACWCPLDLPCHADVLLELANSPAVPSMRAGNDK